MSQIVLSIYVVGLCFSFLVLMPTRSSQLLDSNYLSEEQILPKEYCLRTDSFVASCLKNEVIVMKSAIYGRMKIGKCLQAEGSRMLETYGNDPLFLGCSVDILHVLDKKCSGRNRCEILGTDRDLENVTPCHVALKLYLEALYDCAIVAEQDRSCSVTVSVNSQHIMRSSENKLNCGTKSQPWKLEAPSGQKINISLLDFTSERKKMVRLEQHGCLQYGYVLEHSSSKNVSVCQLMQEREKLIYTSSSNVVQIILSSTELTDLDESPPFLIRINAVGCSNLIPPEDTWLRRTGNVAIVGCYSSRQTWSLQCVESRWTGVMGNCSQDTTKFESAGEPEIEQAQNQYEIMVILFISFVGLAICLIIICVGTVCWKRYYAEYQKYHRQVPDNGSIVRSQEGQQKMITLLHEEL